jgi:hypothetical protein
MSTDQVSSSACTEGWKWKGTESGRKYWKRREPLLLDVKTLALRYGQPEEAVALAVDDDE